jgi:preprotein translocase subunit SecG
MLIIIVIVIIIIIIIIIIQNCLYTGLIDHESSHPHMRESRLS